MKGRDYSLTVALICVGILLVICALVATGCQTCRGFAADVGRLCEDVKYQIPPQENN